MSQHLPICQLLMSGGDAGVSSLAAAGEVGLRTRGPVLPPMTGHGDHVPG